MRRVLIRFLLLGIAFVLIFSAVRISRVDAAVSTEMEITEVVEGAAENTVNGTAVGMMVSGIVMIVLVTTFLGRVEKKKKKYVSSNLSLS